MSKTLDEILESITRDGSYQSSREFLILISEPFVPERPQSPMERRKLEAKEQIKALFQELVGEDVVIDRGNQIWDESGNYLRHELRDKINQL